MIEHQPAGAFFDEDWTAHCSCGFAAYSDHRPEAEARVRKHIADEGIAATRRALEEGRAR